MRQGERCSSGTRSWPFQRAARGFYYFSRRRRGFPSPRDEMIPVITRRSFSGQPAERHSFVRWRWEFTVASRNWRGIAASTRWQFLARAGEVICMLPGRSFVLPANRPGAACDLHPNAVWDSLACILSCAAHNSWGPRYFVWSTLSLGLIIATTHFGVRHSVRDGVAFVPFKGVVFCSLLEPFGEDRRPCIHKYTWGIRKQSWLLGDLSNDVYMQMHVNCSSFCSFVVQHLWNGFGERMKLNEIPAGEIKAKQSSVTMTGGQGGICQVTSYSWASFWVWINRQYDKIMEFARQTDNTWLASSQEGLEPSACLLPCGSSLHPHTAAMLLFAPIITPRCSRRISDVQTLKCEGLTSVILSLVKS